LLHYHEINLKGNNRGWFETQLQQHIASALKGLACGSIQRFAGRLLIELHPDSPIDEIIGRLRTVFGIANLVVAWEVEAAMDSIQAGLRALIPTVSFRSFRMDSRRGPRISPSIRRN